jgi:hypothetical protein
MFARAFLMSGRYRNTSPATAGNAANAKKAPLRGNRGLAELAAIAPSTTATNTRVCRRRTSESSPRTGAKPQFGSGRGGVVPFAAVSAIPRSQNDDVLTTE